MRPKKDGYYDGSYPDEGVEQVWRFMYDHKHGNPDIFNGIA